MINITAIKTFLLEFQNKLCNALMQEDANALLREDIWQHASGGGGISRVITGPVIEKGGVNFSHVFGNSLPQAATLARKEVANQNFEALGVSVVIHPFNPFVPTSHANVRFINIKKTDGSNHWWFGGGFDLTPYYAFEEDCKSWHQTAKNACDVFDPNLYQQLKKKCDDYFYLPHRKEPRGIGGIFFDDWNEGGFEKSFAWMKSVAEHYILAYLPILAKRKNHPFTENEREFQAYRRGRYVEFNLLYDRGTLFGLQSGGRTESILMSLPPVVNWKYDWKPKSGTGESELYEKYLVAKDWVT